jgi:hypothetical protein
MEQQILALVFLLEKSLNTNIIVNKHDNLVPRYNWNIVENGVKHHNPTLFRGGSRGEGRTRLAPPLNLEKNMTFWRKIVIFHTKYLKNFRASLRSVHLFLNAPPLNLKSWIRPCIGMSVTINETENSAFNKNQEERYESVVILILLTSLLH